MEWVLIWCGLGALIGAIAGHYSNNLWEGIVAGFLLGPIIGPGIILLNAHEERSERTRSERQAQPERLP